jgi:hypothetical protein
MPDLEPKDLSKELWREYDFGGVAVRAFGREFRLGGRRYRILLPRTLYAGATTHRVVDSDGVVHCVPAPGRRGCVLRWRNTDPARPVNF